MGFGNDEQLGLAAKDELKFNLGPLQCTVGTGVGLIGNLSLRFMALACVIGCRPTELAGGKYAKGDKFSSGC